MYSYTSCVCVCFIASVEFNAHHRFLSFSSSFRFLFYFYCFIRTANLPDSPLATYKPHDQYVELGNEARFYCEAFVGSIRLPDSKNFISWYQVFEDGMEQNIETQELIRR